MPATNILNSRTARELADSVRRLLGDTDTEKLMVSQPALSEAIIQQYILYQHELGWNPQIPRRPGTGGAVMLEYTLNAGDYQTVQEGESDIVAIGQIWIDRSNTPLVFEPREMLEGWINNDIKINGAVRRGIPQHWSMRVDWVQAGEPPAGPPTEMKNRLLVYPACDETTKVYWPRTVADTEAVDPTSTGKMPFSYQGTYGLQCKIASLMVRSLSSTALENLRLDRGYADTLWVEYKEAVKREMGERAAHVQRDHVYMGSRGY